MRLLGAILTLLLLLSFPLLAVVTITNNSPLPYGSLGNPYSVQLTATGGVGNYQWSFLGNLPPGLGLDANSGIISGTPTAGGTYGFTARALDPPTQMIGTKQFTIGIPFITNASPLPNASLGNPYSVTFNVSADAPGQFTWNSVSGTTPPGLNFNSGTLSGSPTAAGNYNFTVSAFNEAAPGNPSVSKAFSLTVSSAATPPTITTPSQLPPGDDSSPYQTTLAAAGGTPPYNNWTLVVGSGPLPQGLALDPKTGGINGTPFGPGAYNFTVQVTDSANVVATKQFSLNINLPLVLAQPSPLPNGTVGVAYSQDIQVTGGIPPYTFTVGPTTPFGQSTVPPGLTLGSTGGLTGTPTTAGTYGFGVIVTDGTGSVTNKPYAITITPPLAIATPSPLPSGTAGVNYSQNITATGGTSPYTFAFRGNGPPGLTLSPSGVLSGTPPAGGTFNFTIVVTDSLQVTAAQAFQVTIANAAPVLQASAAALSFTTPAGSDPPAAQSFTIVSASGAPINFTLQLDANAANTAAPKWITVRPLKGSTPARIVVSVDPDGMPQGKSSARIRILVTGDASQLPIDVIITLTLNFAAPHLDAVPTFLRFAALVRTPGILEQAILVRNSGGAGSFSFSTAILDKSPWVTDVTPSSGQISQNSTVILRVRINTQGLAVGSYRDVLRITSSAGDTDIPLSVFVADTGSILGLNVTGAKFRVKQGSGTTNAQNVSVLNVGDPATIIDWTADLLSGATWLTLGAARGTASASNPGILSLVPGANTITFAPGSYYSLVRISDSKARNSPQYIAAVLEVVDALAPPVPEPSPTGLFFTAVAGGAPPPAQQVRVFISNIDAVPLQASSDTSDGGNWLVVAPTSGRASTQSPAQFAVSVNQGGTAPLPAGIYKGNANFAIGNAVRSTDVTFVVQPAPTGASPGAEADRPAAGCTPSKLALTSTGLPNNFSAPVQWPAALIVQLNDDCGAPVLNGSAVASFSNGDAPLSLRGDMQTGSYSATWQPGVVTPSMAITVTATSGALAPATAQLIGTTSPNSAAVLFKNGTVNVFNRVTAGALAPGMIVEVYGSGLAAGTGLPGVLPLPTIFNGTFVLVGGFQVPLYFLSNGQLDAQIAAELAPNQQYAIIVSANGALTLPDIIDVVPVQLGIAALPDGHVIAQHGLDFSYVDAGHPAKPGEVLIVYLTGMGSTNPPVKSGDPAPGREPLARVTPPPTVTVDGQMTVVQFAGLTPGLVGLYQINFVVPNNAKTGDLNLSVMLNGAISNATKLTVAP